jgi:membrane protease YdiL (CAAX protease family)
MTTAIAWMRRHTVISYFLIAYAISWSIWIPMAVLGARVYAGSVWPNHIAGLFGPIIAAFIVSAVAHDRAGIVDLLHRLVRWRVAPKWYLVALSPLAFFVVASLVMTASGQGWPDVTELGEFSSLPVMAAPLMWLVLLVVTALPEEAGWRGFAVPELMNTRSLLSTGLIVGGLWALWHVPSMFVIETYRELGWAFLPGFFLGVVSGSVFLAWLYRASGGSVLIVALWHATYNLFSGTAAAHGPVAAVVTTGVMVWAALIVVVEVRKRLLARRLNPPVRPTVS